MSFANHVISSAILAGAVFAAATFPLAVLGSKPLTVQIDNDTVFAGSLRDAAPPCLAIAAALGIGAGATNLAVMGWRHSSRKLSAAEDRISSLSQKIQAQAAQLEEMQFSPSKLEHLGLREFLHSGNGSTATLVQPVAELHPSATRAGVDVPKSESLNGLNKVIALSNVQPFVTFSRSKEESITHSLEHQATDIDLNNPTQVNELLTNLRQVMTQLEQINSQRS
ncbi:hypothetical protein IFO70_08060 [Phormidium tenue FACHB-886]|nr:hypothetical protein [Phormidium tenue FACHB-886]